MTKYKIFKNLFWKGHLLFANKFKNWSCMQTVIGFFDHEVQNLKSYLNSHSFFANKLQK